jgi:hypothetical protein
VRGGKNKDSFFPLNGLEYLQNELGEKTFQKIDSPVWLRRINNTQIVANVIDPQTPHRVKFDIFKRINTGGSPLSAQEIRHCLSKTQSRSFLKDSGKDSGQKIPKLGVTQLSKRVVRTKQVKKPGF